MNFIRSTNCAIFADFTNENTLPNTGSGFFCATEAGLSIDSSLEAEKTFGEPRIADKYNISGPQSAKLSFSYLPMVGSNSATNPENQWAVTNLTGDYQSGHRIKFGNFELRSCYLSSLNIDISPQSPVSFKCNFDVYDLSQVTGQSFTGFSVQNALTTNGSGAYLESLHALALGVSGSGVSLPESKAEISISYNINRSPCYRLGDIYPSTVVLDSVEKQLTIRGENIGQICSFSGGNAIVDLSFSPFSSFITGGNGFVPNNGLFKIFTTGKVLSQNLDVSPDGGLNGQISLAQNVY